MSKIKTLRKELGLTQEALAKKLGVTQGAVWQWESGRTKPRGAKLVALANLLDCTVDELLVEE